MIDKEPHVGVCVIRVEQQLDYLLITVTAHQHLGRHSTSARPELSKQTTDPAEALHLAQQFLEFFNKPKNTSTAESGNSSSGQGERTPSSPSGNSKECDDSCRS
jgi:hypothetical protein